jgi:hypothetical protein
VLILEQVDGDRPLRRAAEQIEQDEELAVMHADFGDAALYAKPRESMRRDSRTVMDPVNALTLPSCEKSWPLDQPAVALSMVMALPAAVSNFSRCT